MQGLVSVDGMAWYRWAVGRSLRAPSRTVGLPGAVVPRRDTTVGSITHPPSPLELPIRIWTPDASTATLGEKGRCGGGNPLQRLAIGIGESVPLAAFHI